MSRTRYIQVILPLKLDWEPYYELPEGMEVKVGDRVRVIFANAFYVAAVSATDVVPSLDPARIVPVEALEQGLPAITPEEIGFWKIVADYYLCAVGEVYKAAYPQMKNHKSRLSLPAWQSPAAGIPLSAEQKRAADAVRAGFDTGKTVLLRGGASKLDIYLQLALETLREGRSVLLLLPEIAFSDQLVMAAKKVVPSALLYHSGMTPGKRKLVAEVLRKGEPNLVLGTRSALFLPHHRLGLILVDEEQDASYKQEAPAPRYHARESAIMLARLHGAHVLLGSGTPSLESLYNAECGRFQKVDLKESFEKEVPSRISIIDTGAEYRKKGMAGSFSLKLLEQIQQTLSDGGQVLLVGPRRTSAVGRQMEGEILEFCPGARIAFLDGTPEDQAETLRAFAEGEFDILLGNTLMTRGFESKKLGLAAWISTDGILSRQDFRADERSLQLLERLRGRCRHLVIQTRAPHHPVFSALQEGNATGRLLEERRLAGYPPYSRMVRLAVRDANAKRLDFLSRELAGEMSPLGVPVEGPYPSLREENLREIRLLLPRDKSLTARKTAIGQTVTAFEQARKYTGHIAIDVDPA